jgi:TolB-like protein/tetratricopeptide (TPR) repeat protein
MADVFISYARIDRERVAPLVAAIEAQGWTVWWDPEIDPGQEFDRLIAAELKAAAAVLVVWTPNSVTSRWVRGEAREGADRGILVPVRFEAASLPIDVRALHTTDFDGWGEDPRSPRVQEVLRALRAIIARERASRSAAMNSDAAHSAAARESDRITICVLPFANLSGDPGQEYFSDGITEDIITELSRWRLLAVRSRSASFRYRGVAADMNQVARELNVRFVVEGSVRRMGERIRTSVQLIDTETGNHIWGEKFDRGLDEIFAVQDRVVQKIVSTLVGRVQVSYVERARRKPPASLAAYECVLKANALSWDDPEGAADAIRLVEKAIELDPGYGFAHALLASLRQSQWTDDLGDSDAALDEAYGLAMRAVSLDDGESTCHAILGHICARRRSFELAVQYAQRAVELNPTNQWNAADLGSILVYAGQSEEALTWFTRVREIDPYFDEPWYWRSTSLAYMNMHRYADALSKLNHVRGRPYRYVALVAGCHAQLGDMDQARASTADCLSMRPRFSIAQFIRKEPFKIAADAEHLASCLRLAGLPE